MRKRKKNRQGYASGSFMASLPGMTKNDKKYYTSNKYAGNKPRKRKKRISFF